MAQADSVPSPIPSTITGASATPSTNDASARRCLINQALLGVKMAAISYATAVLLLAPFPWNVVLLLPLFLDRNEHLQLSEFDAMPAARHTACCGRGNLP